MALENLFRRIPTHFLPHSVPPEGPSPEPPAALTGGSPAEETVPTKGPKGVEATEAPRRSPREEGVKSARGDPRGTGTGPDGRSPLLREGLREPLWVPELSPGLPAVGARNVALRALVEIEQAVRRAPGDPGTGTLADGQDLGDVGVPRDSVSGTGTLGSLAALVARTLASVDGRSVGPGDHAAGSGTARGPASGAGGPSEAPDWDAATLAEWTDRLYQVGTSLLTPLSWLLMPRCGFSIGAGFSRGL